MPYQERINITVEADCESLPPAKPCYVCGGETEKVQDLRHYCRSSPSIVVADGLPGYRCKECKAGYFHPSTTLKFLTEAKEYLTRPEDASIRAVIEARIASIQELLSEDNAGDHSS